MNIFSLGGTQFVRKSSRLPPVLVAQAPRSGPAAAWEFTVDVVIETGVRAVLLAGELVGSDGDYFKAFWQLALNAEDCRRLTLREIVSAARVEPVEVGRVVAWLESAAVSRQD